MITSLTEFVDRVRNLNEIQEAYNLFEFETSEKVRDAVYRLADANAREPLRSAMHNLGFTSY